MPPTSVNIFEEGAEIVSFKIVNGGMFDRDGLVDYMVEKPSRYPGSSGCRNIRDVESDLKAVCIQKMTIAIIDLPIFTDFLPQQIAANHKGIQLIHASKCLFSLK